jgi:16S rRNA (cytidine1402-2'-O)-methyltransferase
MLIIERLQRGERVAYVSDAGTPAVSDPGARLVAATRAAGLRVLPLPGASSITTALSAAGAMMTLGDAGFVFAGFLPTKAGERDHAVGALLAEKRTVVILEAPHRIEALARAMAPLGPRLVTVGRELTKQFEEIATVAAQDFAAWLSGGPQRTRGEFALVLHPPASDSNDSDESHAISAESMKVLKLLLAELPLKSAVKLTAEITSTPRNELYEAALKIKASAEPEGD